MLKVGSVRFALLASVLSLGLSACAGSSAPSLFPLLGKAPEEEPKPETKVQPGCKTAEKCAGVLRKLVSGPKRDWIGKAQPADAYDDGTRLFAYRALRRKMTCDELERAYEETRAAMPALKGETHAGSRTLMGKVNGELRAERLQRCRAKSKAS